MTQFTKKAIAVSLKQLMKEKSLDKITVKDITANCGVNRQTFYYHFRDIYQLISWIYTVEAVGSIENYKSYDTWEQGLLMIFEYVSQNLAFCKNCFHSSSRDILERFIYDSVFDLLLNVVNEVCQDINIEESRKEFIANFYCYAFIGIMTQWITNGAKEDPAAIIDKIQGLIGGNIERVIGR